MSEEKKEDESTNYKKTDDALGFGQNEENNNLASNNILDNPDPLIHPEFVIDLNTKYDEDLVRQLQQEEG